ncbi:patatin-like phospholipase family protein [uncultured Tateyamaria sp.]|uniref:patatin-like phospholipase family protein n=1 Tax=uncultured Tateyamaria sp. TaxID=455651 RepID=UPI00261EAC4E|nr:patatin-like phospholipase family protein [uncultured Tateyamaria sp.]
MGQTKKINLALQGGGSHGAFTWGVIDRILEDGRLEFEAISGTSAGAMNAVVCADGMMRDGNDGARERLEHFWLQMSKSARSSPIKRTPIDVFMGNWSLEHSPGYHFFDALTRVMSPYQTNPFNMNPLHRLIEEVVDFDRVRACDCTKLFISATNVETGRVKVFDSKSLTADMVMASACLPMVFQAVEIDGVPYWDGGYMGNPALFPFHTQTECSDIVVIQINPVERAGAPRTAQEIMNRVNEISFNSSLLKELRAIDFVSRMIREGKLSDNEYRDTRVHIIENQDVLKPLGASSKLNAEWAFLTHLRDLGRATAQNWLDANFAHIGNKATVDVAALFQGIGPQHQG